MKNARSKQMLRENGYEESIVSKIFKRITNNKCKSDTQEEEIKMSINLPYVEGTSDNLPRNSDLPK